MKVKGHTKIELTDVKTGKTDVIESDNMQTNALQNIFSELIKWFGYANINSYFLPLVDKALKGIYIFDNTLTENVNNYYLPNLADSKLTGYAGNITSDGNDNMRGDYNVVESGAIENGYKFVWDFGTNDANGEIAAVALTHYMAGHHGYHYNPKLAFSAPSENTGNVYNNYKGLGYTNESSLINFSDGFIGYDKTTETITRIVKTSATNINVYKYRLAYNSVKLTGLICNLELIETNSITINDNVMTDTAGVIWVDGENGYYYGLISSGGDRNNTNIQICKINKSTLEYTNASSYTYPINIYPLRFAAGYYGSFMRQAVIDNGYLYVLRTNNAIVKISLSNPNEIETIDGTEYTPIQPNVDDGFNFIYKDYNNNIVTNGVIMGRDGTFMPNEQAAGLNTRDNYIYYSRPILYQIAETYFTSCTGTQANEERRRNYPNLQYLATINNLDTPVTKTAAKTMKITYTLTYAEE